MSGKGMDRGAGGRGAAGRGGERGDVVMNTLRFEREKNKVLLDEVIALEDALVNRQIAEFDAVISDDTREFWREQLLSNREKAECALADLARMKTEDGGQRSEDGRRRPLHNRATARPAFRQGFVAQGAPAAAAGGTVPGDDRAAKIRNRAHEISRAERVPFSAAFRRAEKEFAGQ